MLVARGSPLKASPALLPPATARSAANLGEIFRVFRFRAVRIAAAVGGGLSKRASSRDKAWHTSNSLAEPDRGRGRGAVVKKRAGPSSPVGART